jgi:DNA-binding PadR family transcriptional regulator
MTAARLLVLSLLASVGPMHGHHLRRRAEIIDVDRWAEVSIGSLYSTLHRLEDERLITPLRREQAGNYPARTVYAISDEGREELKLLHAQALERLQLHADPVDLAIAVSGGSQEAEIRLLLEQRRRALETRLAYDRAQHERMAASGMLTARSRAVFRHWELRLGAELQWHSEVEALLAQIVAAAAPALRPDLLESVEPGASAAGTVRLIGLPRTRRPNPRSSPRRGG